MWPCQAAMFICRLEFLELQHFVQNEPAKSTAVQQLGNLSEHAPDKPA